jgi:DNA-binding LytR/AlgR family response regulator
MKVKCLIVDDEPLARKLIVSHVARVESLALVGECATAIQAANLLRTKSVDLIFLDIQMPELNGLDFIKTLKTPPAIILTTAHREFALEAFELNVCDYLLKPVSFDRFLKGINKYFDQITNNKTVSILNEHDSFIYVKADKRDHKIDLNEILYMESLDDYVKVVLHTKTLITRENISTLEKRLPPELFVRIHRSFIVPTKKIQTVSAEGLQINGVELPFGRAFKKAALAIIYKRTDTSALTKG